jgi:hypothetical protein
MSFTERMALSGIEGGLGTVWRQLVMISTKSSPKLELGE